MFSIPARHQLVAAGARVESRVLEMMAVGALHLAEADLNCGEVQAAEPVGVLDQSVAHGVRTAEQQQP